MAYFNVDIMKWGIPYIDNLFGNILPKYNHIWIFGYGTYGKALCHYLNECGFKIDGFVVSLNTNELSNTEDYVVDLSEFRKNNPDFTNTIVLLAVNHGYYPEILPNLTFLGDNLEYIDNELLALCVQRYPKKKASIIYSVVDHCNLSCYGCGAASPVIKEESCSVEQFCLDLRACANLFSSSLGSFGFSGGEPLLHPEITSLLDLARQILGTDTKISMATNGTLLHLQSKLFWETCAKNQVSISWSYYPIKYPYYDDLLNTARKYGVFLRHHQRTGLHIQKTSYEFLLSEKPCSKIGDYLFCEQHNSCTLLSEGTLYTCPFPYSAKFLNLAFNANIPIFKDNGINIHEASKQDVLNFLSRRIPLCDYCGVRQRREVGRWRPSKKEKSEWIID